MKWIQANPVGMVLAGFAGFLMLVALIIGVLWTLPVSVDTDENDGVDLAGADKAVVAEKLEPLAEYEVINQRPVFNESRLPTIEDSEELLAEDLEGDPDIAVTDAPDVKLTGIIITPGMKLASLTPNDASIDNVMAYEGDALTGEFQGWQLSRVDPRKVVLESRDGQTLHLDLEVHDAKINQPIKPVAPKQVANTRPDSDAEQGQPSANMADDEDEPLSRAEQIRQRIAERREELRLEQEQQQQTRNNRVERAASAPQNNAYQNAIRARINSQRKDKSSDDN